MNGAIQMQPSLLAACNSARLHACTCKHNNMCDHWVSSKGTAGHAVGDIHAFDATTQTKLMRPRNKALMLGLAVLNLTYAVRSKTYPLAIARVAKMVHLSAS